MLIRTLQVLEPAKRVVARMPGFGGCNRLRQTFFRQRHRHPGVRTPVARLVPAGTAVQIVRAGIPAENVVAVPASQRIVAAETAQMVVPRVAGQLVSGLRPVDRLEPAERVAVRMPPGRRARRVTFRQRHRHPGGLPPIRHRVPARTAVQNVLARAPAENVVAATAPQRVPAALTIQVIVPGIARQTVAILVRSRDALDPDQRIPARMAPRRRARPKIHLHRPGRTVVGHCIVTLAAVQGVGAVAALQPVVAAVAIQLVRIRAAIKRVAVGAAIQTVGAVAAIQVVVAALAPQRVRAAQPIQGFVVGSADECVVAVVMPSQNRHELFLHFKTLHSVRFTRVCRSPAPVAPVGAVPALERADRWRERPRRQAGAPPAPTGENASLARRWNL